MQLCLSYVCYIKSFLNNVSFVSHYHQILPTTIGKTQKPKQKHESPVYPLLQKVKVVLRNRNDIKSSKVVLLPTQCTVSYSFANMQVSQVRCGSDTCRSRQERTVERRVCENQPTTCSSNSGRRWIHSVGITNHCSVLS